MKVTEYIEKNRVLPRELADVLLAGTSIWTNDACLGYCIQALEDAGMDRLAIQDILHCLHRAFDTLTVEEAERKWVTW